MLRLHATVLTKLFKYVCKLNTGIVAFGWAGGGGGRGEWRGIDIEVNFAHEGQCDHHVNFFAGHFHV